MHVAVLFFFFGLNRIRTYESQRLSDLQSDLFNHSSINPWCKIKFFKHAHLISGLHGFKVNFVRLDYACWVFVFTLFFNQSGLFFKT